MSASMAAGWYRPASLLTLPRLPPVLARNLPWIVLILLSITFAEFLTGSTPVLLPILNPVSALFLVGLYGAGVLLVREASVRWAKGWPTVLLLGVAYGIAEEGIGTKTFFGPAGVGILGSYGHWLGVNWVWSTELAIFHAVFSIALPIAVVALLFPDTVGRSFLPTRRALATVIGVFVTTVALMFVLFNRPEIPSPALLVASLAVIGAFVLLARWAPSRLGEFGVPPVVGPLRVSPMLLGGTFVFGFFGLSWIGPALVPIPAVVVAAIVAWSLAFGLYIVRHRDPFSRPRVRVDFIVGSLSFSFLLAGSSGSSATWGSCQSSPSSSSWRGGSGAICPRQRRALPRGPSEGRDRFPRLRASASRARARGR